MHSSNRSRLNENPDTAAKCIKIFNDHKNAHWREGIPREEKEQQKDPQNYIQRVWETHDALTASGSFSERNNNNKSDQTP